MVKNWLKKIAFRCTRCGTIHLRLFRKEPAPYEFSGLTLNTTAKTPWFKPDFESGIFQSIDENVMGLIKAGSFKLTQFAEEKNVLEILKGFKWRHYIIYWTVRYANMMTKAETKVLVEAGVCDGLTSYYAMRALRSTPYHAFLYDAWAPMKEENLRESEKNMAGEYAYLSLENTKQNLQAFEGKTTYIKGYIPESFKTSEMPENITWLHIDLNSAKATIETLAALYDRISSGGVVLFDDYAWQGYEDTKVAVDEFFSDKKGMMLPLPTGQGIFFKF